MNEAEWLSSEDPAPMLRHLTHEVHRAPDAIGDHPRAVQPSSRKLRLFACACTLLLPGRDAGLRRAVGAALAFADGGLGGAEMEAARWGRPPGPWTVCHPDAGEAAYYVIRDDSLTGRRAEMAALLRDVFGNPFRPALSPRCARCDGTGRACYHNAGAGPSHVRSPCRDCGGSGTDPDRPWLTPAALSVARRAYDDRDFAALPVLADALEEAGCEDADVLAHCRHAMTSTLARPMHVRGCWALDLVLGKS